jgi:arsenate reductase (glutaredoxin)
MTVTIWHNPKCATSRKVLEMIRAAGVTPQVVDYVKAPPSAAALKAALKAMAMKPRALLRRKGTPYDELGLDDTTLSDAALIAAMHTHHRASGGADSQGHAPMPPARAAP